MISLVRAAFLVVLCAVSAVAQDAQKITVEYDRFKDVTTYGLEPMKTSNPSVSFFALFQCPGKTECRPDVVVFGFAMLNLYEEAYKGQGVARAIRDGVRQEPYQLKYLGTKTQITLLPSDVFMAGLTAASLTKIANSKVVEYQIDSTEFAMTPDNLAGLRNLVGRMKSQ